MIAAPCSDVTFHVNLVLRREVHFKKLHVILCALFCEIVYQGVFWKEAWLE
jgi:hypothetical protein